MAGIRRQRVKVELAGEDGSAVYDVELINPDFLRVEAELPRFGLPTKPKAAPMGYMTSVAWAACKRLGLYDGTLLDFRNRDCVALDYDKPDEDADTVDPTGGEVGTDSR